MTKPLSKPRFVLLTRLIENDGHCHGKHLTAGARRLGSRMQLDRLTDWELPDRTGSDMDDWVLHITDAGRTAVASELQRRERAGKWKKCQGMSEVEANAHPIERAVLRVMTQWQREDAPHTSDIAIGTQAPTPIVRMALTRLEKNGKVRRLLRGKPTLWELVPHA